MNGGIQRPQLLDIFVALELEHRADDRDAGVAAG
jgi:hypothetical protein